MVITDRVSLTQCCQRSHHDFMLKPYRLPWLAVARETRHRTAAHLDSPVVTWNALGRPGKAEDPLGARWRWLFVSCTAAGQDRYKLSMASWS
jgi:hypothetical protein